jgi:hypothetical protein
MASMIAWRSIAIENALRRFGSSNRRSYSGKPM